MKASVAAASALILALASLLGLAAASSYDDLCYQISWDLANPLGPKRKVLRPVTHFPPQHALVQNDICGSQVAPGKQMRRERGRGRV